MREEERSQSEEKRENSRKREENRVGAPLNLSRLLSDAPVCLPRDLETSLAVI